MTIESLVTFGGAAAAAGAITELLKPLLSKLPFKVSPRIISYLAALAVMTLGFIFSGSRSGSDYVLCAINAAFISLSSNGGYDLICAAFDSTADKEEDK